MVCIDFIIIIILTSFSLTFLFFLIFKGNGLGIDEPNTLDIAGLVAQFFRELPEPLLTYDLYYNWVEAASMLFIVYYLV